MKFMLIIYFLLLLVFSAYLASDAYKKLKSSQQTKELNCEQSRTKTISR